MANSKRDVHVVFLGPTGCGKSRLCNFLLEDDKAFKVNASFQSVTKGIESKWKSINTNNELIAFKFIDTQGLADTTMTNAEVVSTVAAAVKQDIQYVNYFVIILRAGRLTDENRNALEDIIKAFKLSDDERKKHAFLLLSHCECSNQQLRDQYEKECLADRTLKKLLIVRSNRAINFQCIGLPQPSEVNEWMYEGIMKWMNVQRKGLLEYLSKPIEGIRPTNDGFFENICTIL
ncbi:unnamed protein product [Adineta ricciae]|uniref:AIG1-type G domain-containing protein n=1 Tax=Adineta ricciae TaxID=249248 RepID=A0A815GNE2_ADIRI|nr:unnamed protein product [Adineta ricciae]